MEVGCFSFAFRGKCLSPSTSASRLLPSTSICGDAFTSRFLLSHVVCSKEEPAIVPMASTTLWVTSWTHRGHSVGDILSLTTNLYWRRLMSNKTLTSQWKDIRGLSKCGLIYYFITILFAWLEQQDRCENNLCDFIYNWFKSSFSSTPVPLFFKLRLE